MRRKRITTRVVGGITAAWVGITSSPVRAEMNAGVGGLAESGTDISNYPIRWQPATQAKCAGDESCPILGIAPGQSFVAALIHRFAEDAEALNYIDSVLAEYEARAKTDYANLQSELQAWHLATPDALIPFDSTSDEFLGEVSTYRAAIKAELATPGSADAYLVDYDGFAVPPSSTAPGVGEVPLVGASAFGSTIIGSLTDDYHWRYLGFPYSYGWVDKSGFTHLGDFTADYTTSINGREQQFRWRYHSGTADEIGASSTELWCKRDHTGSPDPWCEGDDDGPIGLFGSTPLSIVSAWQTWWAFDEHFGYLPDYERKYVEVDEFDVVVADSYGVHPINNISPNIQNWRVFCHVNSDGTNLVCHYHSTPQ